MSSFRSMRHITFILTAMALVMVVSSSVSVLTTSNASPGKAEHLPDHLRFLDLNGYRFDPLIQEPTLPSHLRYSHELDEGRYRLVQFADPVTEEMKAQVTSAGVTILHYVGGNAFIVRAENDVLRTLPHMSTVRWTGSLQPAYKLSPSLDKGFDEVVQKAIEFHQGQTPTGRREIYADTSREVPVQITT